MSRNRPQGTTSPERLVLHRVLINSNRFYIHTNLIKFVIAHFKLENRSMSCTFQLICIASLLAFSTFILVFMQNCRDCRFSNSEMTPMLPFNTRYDNLSRDLGAKFASSRRQARAFAEKKTQLILHR